MSTNATDIATSSAADTSQATSSASVVPPTTPPSTLASSFIPPTSSFISLTSAAPPPAPSSIVLITSVITENPASTGGINSPSVVVVTSTAPPILPPTSSLTFSTSPSPSSTTSDAAALATSDAESSETSGGLPQGAKIAVAVVVPIVAIALLVVGLLFFWKKRKARKDAEEQRKKEMEEYGFNPNNDPSLPAVGATYGENKSEEAEDGVGYRGWGTTNSTTTRKPSTNLGSGTAGIGMAVSDGGSNGGGYGYQTSPSNITERPSDGHSVDPLIASPGARAPSHDSDLGALGAAPVASSARPDRGVHRGPSNASSAYSTGAARSDVSDDVPLPGGAPAGPYYHEDSPYHQDGQGPPYGDSPYGAGQPVIRDVQARRNTRIEKPSVFTQQGNSGIAQNF